jgi:hypothetical protein
MHDCHDCGQACDCDGDDVWRTAPPDCHCDCYDAPDDYDPTEWDDDAAPIISPS